MISGKPAIGPTIATITGSTVAGTWTSFIIRTHARRIGFARPRNNGTPAELRRNLLAVTATPEVTLTPFGIEVTVEVEVPTVWEKFTASADEVLADAKGSVYEPPSYIWSNSDNASGSVVGRFRFNRESVRVTCQYWHNADQTDLTDVVASRVFGVTRFAASEENDPDPVDCGNTDLVKENIVARQWQITLSRSYSGTGRIRSVSWRLTATYGPDGECFGDSDITCQTEMLPDLQTYLEKVRTDATEDVPESITDIITFANSDCKGSKSTEGESPNEVTRYEHTCTPMDKTLPLQHLLTLRYTHDKTRDFLPEP